MNRSLALSIPLTMWLVSAAGCEPELVSPTGGSLVVDNVLSPVRIHTSRLSGAGRIDAWLPTGIWTLIHLEPQGAFIFEERLPNEAWHCSDTGGTEGCVARLRVAHDAGGVGANPVFGAGIVHVCTANYLQRTGRRHCGVRTLESEEGGLFTWTGDPLNRLIVGSHEFLHVDADAPPTDARVEEESGRFFDYRWDPESDPRTLDLGASPQAPWQAYSMDVGACSFFIPWEWEHRLTDAYYAPGLGAALQDRGLAERFLDEMIDTAEPQSQTEVNALLWVDGVVGIVPNEGASPEFHYRLSPETGEPQMCFRQYFHASSDIAVKPDHWYRFDQALGAFFLELVPFVGRCGSKNVSFLYCGTPRVDRGLGGFEIDPSSVHIAHQGYPWGKILCNNQFVPSFIDGVRQTFEPGGDGARQIDAGIGTLVDSLSETLGLEVRRLELAPRGMYVITAESPNDPQFGLGDCDADVGRFPPLPAVHRPTDTDVMYRMRGVTRF